jgi:hypothetical protein
MAAWVVCRMCGKYILAGGAVSRGYCSEECTRVFESCVNCGTYFPKGGGFDGEHCTRACTIRYQIMRKYGPEPVTVVTEV